MSCFEQSTQANFWLYDEQSLLECRREACVGSSTVATTMSNAYQQQHHGMDQNIKPRKAACGYKSSGTEEKDDGPSFDHPLTLPPDMQETLVQFHSHQMQRLIGPNAILPELQRSVSALSTAIMLFRRFYLSNSVFDYHPRHIATASALLAVKVDCEDDLKINLLSLATLIVHRKAQNAPLCRAELPVVSVDEIEEAERNLLEGLDFRLRCHHPYGAIKVLTSDIITTSSYGDPSYHYGGHRHQSPTSVVTIDQGRQRRQKEKDVYNRALAVAQAALVYSDVNFLFPPGQIAFAAVAIAFEGKVGDKMHEYLQQKFPQKTFEERNHFEKEVTRIVSMIAHRPCIDMNKFAHASSSSSGTFLQQRTQNRRRTTLEYQASKINQAFKCAAIIRDHLQQSRGIRWSGTNSNTHYINAAAITNMGESHNIRKRIRQDHHHHLGVNSCYDEYTGYPSYYSEQHQPQRPYKSARVTPTPMHHHPF